MQNSLFQLHVFAATASGSGSFDTAVQTGGLMLFKLLFLAGSGMVAIAGYRCSQEQTTPAVWGIIGGMVMAFAGQIMEALFDAGNLSSAVIHFGS